MTLLRWSAVMAWRDGRKSWRRLLVYLSATGIGIAALVAAGSFRHNLQGAIHLYAKPLLGADLVVEDRRRFTQEAEAALSAKPWDRTRETRVTTVVHFPQDDAGRLMDVRGIEPSFPFYGDVKTDPAGALVSIHAGPGILIEKNVMAEFGLSAGDTVQIGTASFIVAGALDLVPGEAVASLFSAPRAYISRDRLAATGLLQERSLSRHNIYFRIPDPRDLERAATELKEMAVKNGWRVLTVADRERSLGRRAQNAERFLNLSALVMLILGGLGVGSIMMAYARDKRSMAATLRCLGAPGGTTLFVFALQAVFIGIFGSLLGGILGIGLQAVMPRLLSAFVVVDIPFFISWTAVATGVGVGASVSFLFTLMPLLPLRNVSPLSVFRVDEGNRRPAHRDPLLWASAITTGLILFGFSAGQMPNPWIAASVPFSVAFSLAALALASRWFVGWIRRLLPPSWPFPVRQGLAGLFRPNSQTFLLIPGLGLGAALLFTVSFTRDSLLSHLNVSTAGREANMALIDVQSDQVEPLSSALRQIGREVTEIVPIVSMRLSRVKDRTAEELRREDRLPRWALNREYRSTYHELPGIVAKGAGDPVPVSMEEGLAETLGVAVGDTLAFDIQGVPLDVKVAGLRKVDWFQLRPNFFMVFPPAVLEEAPQFSVIMARAGSAEEAAEVQRLVRRDFPNVSSMDLRVVMQTIDGYVEKISFVLRMMGFVVVLTGLLILAGALLATRRDRIIEAALLRTLGASRFDVRVIHTVEYGLTGLFSGFLGLLLAILGTYALSRTVFEIPFRPDWSFAPLGLSGMVLLTAVTGFTLGRGMLNRPPLSTLREE